jgi:hypothetical protein
MRRIARLVLAHVAVPAALVVLASPLAAQARAGRPAPPRAADAASRTITETDLRRHLAVISDDSMLGRDTPSRGLDQTADYIAGVFKRLGLKPMGDSGSYLQRYPIERRRLLVDSTTLTVTDDSGHAARLPFSSSAYLFNGNASSEPISGPVLLIGGRVDPARLAAAEVRGHIVMWPIDFDSLPPNIELTVGLLFQYGARAIVAVTNPDSAMYQASMRRQRAPRTARLGEAGPGMLIVTAIQDSLVRRLPSAGPLLASVRTDTVMRVERGRWQASLQIRDTLLERAFAPNVVGLIEGTDPKLRGEYVVYSAHMDHIGITPGAADSINNGADDDGSGTVGVLELAEAFAQTGARPRRSVIFLTVSGEEKGLWGSEWFVSHSPVPLGQVVADLNLDMIGRNWTDTVAVIGLEHSTLADDFRRVEAAHPELRMHGVRDPWPEENIFFRSDHFNFARHGVPILFFTSGLHADYHKPSDSAEKIEAEKEARLLRMLFWLGRHVGDAPGRPLWNPDSYRQIVTEPSTMSGR